MWLLLFILLVSLLPLMRFTLRLDLQYCPGKLNLLIRLAWLKLHKDWQLMLLRSPHGHLLSTNGSDPRDLPAMHIHGSHAQRMLRDCLHDPRIRRFMLRHIRLTQLDISLRLHHSDAAATALMTGLLRSCFGLLPHTWRDRTRLIAVPEFASSGSLCTRCILQFRLGTILITAGMLLLSGMAEHARTTREARIWNTPSEN